MRKVALVTGGAKGIGAAICRELASNHFDVVINYLTSEKEALALSQISSCDIISAGLPATQKITGGNHG